jgi:hypothetical protein
VREHHSTQSVVMWLPDLVGRFRVKGLGFRVYVHALDIHAAATHALSVLLSACARCDMDGVTQAAA